MECSRCSQSTPVAHVIDATIREAALKLRENVPAHGSICPACLRVLLSPAERAPYLERSA